MKHQLLLAATLGSFAISGAQAGETVDASILTEATASDALATDLTIGYDSRYIYRGLWFGNDSVWADLTVSKEIAPKWTLAGNLIYVDVSDDALAYSEADFGASLAYASDYGTFTLGAAYYEFFDGFAGDNGTGPGGQTGAFEMSLGYGREIFYGIDLNLLAAHDFRVDAQYFEASLGKSWALCDRVGLDASAAVGYGLNDYYSSALSGDKADGFTHALVTIALPIALQENVTLTPHVSANFSGDARKRGNAASIGDDEVFYGISLGVSF